MKGKRLGIEELERLPIGTVVSVSRGYFYVDYLTHRCGGKLCLMPSDVNRDVLYYEDILKLEVYESTRENPVSHIDGFSSVPYVTTCNDGLVKKFLDDLNNIAWTNTSVNPLYAQGIYKLETRIKREFNIAKKKEYKVKDLNGNEKHKLNKATLEILVDIALEENNEEDFIKYSSKLKKYYKKEVVQQ